MVFFLKQMNSVSTLILIENLKIELINLLEQSRVCFVILKRQLHHKVNISQRV